MNTADRIEINFAPVRAPGNRAPGMTSDGRYNETLAKAEVCMAHLPESAWVATYDQLPGSGAKRIGTAEVEPARHGPSVLRDFRLTMTMAQVRDAIDQIDAHEAVAVEQRKQDAEDERAFIAARVAELETALATVRAAIEPVRGTHAAFGALATAAAKACAVVADNIRELRATKVRVKGSKTTALRKYLADALADLEREREAKDADYADYLRRKGIAV